MINYYSLSKLLQNGHDIEPIINEILLVTISAKTTYPEYTKWFLEKHIPGIYLGTRDTIIAVHNLFSLSLFILDTPTILLLCTAIIVSLVPR